MLSLKHSGGMLEKVPENVQKDFGECSRGDWEMFQRSQGMFKKIPGNVQKDFRQCSGESSRRFWRMLLV